MSNEIRDVFLTEAQEIIQNLETDIVILEEQKDGNTEDLLNKIFRYFHTIKGSSGIAGFTHIYDFAHKVENLLDNIRNDKIQINSDIITIILQSIDWIKYGIFIDEHNPNNDARTTLEKKISAALGNQEELHKMLLEESNQVTPEAQEESGIREYSIKAFFNKDIFFHGIDPLLIIDDLISLGTVKEKTVFFKGMTEFFELDPEMCYSGWHIVLKTEEPLQKIEDVFLFVKDDNDITIEDITSEDEKEPSMEEKKLGEILVDKGIISEKQFDEVLEIQDSTNKKMGELVVAKGFASESEIEGALEEQEKIKTIVQSSTVRIDSRKLDSIMNLLGEIVIGQSSISQIASELENETGFRLKNAMHGLDRITREFQEQLMQIRMVPVGPTFEQFRRFVRDTSKNLNKSIRFEVSGKETELDKTVIERINDPLKHMIRNAIDHGIESAQERKSASKPKEGLLKLNAYHQEGNIYIEVKDDGRGLDPEKLRKKAIDLKLIKPDEEISETRLFNMIFMPGFSTAKEVGDLSGRGVGMDIVKTNIENLRGTVEIDSTKEKGTTFRIKLPLTLAIIDGMLVRVGNNIYIIPLLSIVQSLRPKKEDIKTVEDKGEMIHVRGEYISFLRLYEQFGLNPVQNNPWDALVVIVESGGNYLGLMVDDLLGQQQVVIKNISGQITANRAISGAAVLGDGVVALILDIHGMFEQYTVN